MGHEDVMDSVLGNPATQEMTSAQAIHSHRVHPKFRCFGGLCGRTLRPSLPPNPLELALATSYLTGHHFQHSFLESDDPSTWTAKLGSRPSKVCIGAFVHTQMMAWMKETFGQSLSKYIHPKTPWLIGSKLIMIEPSGWQLWKPCQKVSSNSSQLMSTPWSWYSPSLARQHIMITHPKGENSQACMLTLHDPTYLKAHGDWQPRTACTKHVTAVGCILKWKANSNSAPTVGEVMSAQQLWDLVNIHTYTTPQQVRWLLRKQTPTNKSSEIEAFTWHWPRGSNLSWVVLPSNQ